MQRIFIDSRDRVTGTNEEFSISLPRSIVVPFESLAVLDTVLIPTSTYTVNATNSNFYYIERNAQNQSRYLWVTLQTGFYSVESLGTELARALNGSPQKEVQNLYTVDYVPRTGKYVIDNPLEENESFSVFTTEFLLEYWEGLASSFPHFTDPSMINDAGKLLGFLYGPTVQCQMFTSGLCRATAPQISNLMPHHQMFIKGDLGVPFASFGPRGDGTILRRVVITAPANSMNYDHHSSMYDNIIVAPGSYNNFKFKLCGWDGQLVN